MNNLEVKHMGLEPGQQLRDRYRLVQKIGEGGMAEVFRAHDLHLDRHVAVKVIHRHLAQTEAATTRFEREIKAMVRHNHPNVVSIFDAGSTENGDLFLVMELLEGSALSDILAEGPLRPLDVLDISIQLARALDVVHNAEVIHRDAHPGNIFLIPGSQGWRLKLLDFGIARDLGETPLTVGDKVLGNPHYMSPEQALGSPVDHRSDLYVLGAVTYRAITGKTLFEAANPMAVMLKHIHEPVPTLDVEPPGLGLLLSELLEKDPEDRPASAFEVAERLVLIRDRLTKPLAVTTHAPPARTSPVAQKRPRFLNLFAAAGGLTALVGLPVAAGGILLFGMVFGAIVNEPSGPVMYNAFVPDSEPICSLVTDCQLGSDDSCKQIGQAYEAGTGVAVNPLKAREWYEEACRSGSNEACLRQEIMVAEETILEALQQPQDTEPLKLERLRAQACADGMLDVCVVDGSQAQPEASPPPVEPMQPVDPETLSDAAPTNALTPPR